MNQELKHIAMFNELWDSSVVNATSVARSRSRLDFAREAELDKALVSTADGYYILIDNSTNERVNDGEPYFFKDYVTKKHTFQIFHHALSLGLNNFSIFFEWDVRYFDSFEDKFDQWTMAEHGGCGGSQELITYQEPPKAPQQLSFDFFNNNDQ